MATIIDILLYIQMGTVILALIYGSITDIVRREVEPLVWMGMTIEGLITTILIFIFETNKKEAWGKIGINFAVGLLLALIIGYTGAMGGGDAFCLFALSLNTAYYPINLGYTENLMYQIFPQVFNTFFNWLVVMVVLYPFPLLFYNIYLVVKKKYRLFDSVNASMVEKALIMVSGYLIPVDRAKERVDLVYSEIYNEEKEQWKLQLFMKAMEIEEEEEFKKEIEEKIKETNKEKIWVKVLPPGIVFLLIGYIVNMLIGNIFFTLVF